MNDVRFSRQGKFILGCLFSCAVLCVAALTQRTVSAGLPGTTTFPSPAEPALRDTNFVLRGPKADRIVEDSKRTYADVASIPPVPTGDGTHNLGVFGFWFHGPDYMSCIMAGRIASPLPYVSFGFSEKPNPAVFTNGLWVITFPR
jgi:hypothetical protein